MGVGKLIMEDLLNNLRDISCVHLISTTGNENFYRCVGLKRVKTAMARYLNPALDEEYLGNITVIFSLLGRELDRLV